LSLHDAYADLHHVRTFIAPITPGRPDKN
jgi:hypothetical protein